jgi:O-antigen ligase
MKIEERGIEQPRTSLAGAFSGLSFAALSLLCATLPFEFFSRFKLFDKPFTNLELIFFLVTALSAITLMVQVIKGGWKTVFAHRLVAGLFLAASFLVAIISSLISPQKEAGLDWTWQFGLYIVFWLAVPLWLTIERIQFLTLILVVGGVISALFGFAEFFGLNLNGIFKEKPTNAGAFLRLSGSFSYANIAAMYYEMILAFAVGGWFVSLRKGKPWLITLLWLVACIILLEAIFLTYSRGAWLGLLGSLLLIGFIARRLFILLSVLALGLWFFTFIFSPLMSLRLTPYSDQEWYRAQYTYQLPSSFDRCEKFVLNVTVTNTSPFTWEKSGQYKINLTYHWLDADKNVYRFAVASSDLTNDLPPNSRQTLLIDLYVPEKTGDYFLVWDMHQANISWFSLKSAKYEPIPVMVLGDDTKACSNSTPTNNYRYPPKLPDVLGSPSREQLWQAAVSMILERPLGGFGAGNFKFNYQNYIVPKPEAVLARVHANNVYLELLSGIGILGFTALGGFFWWVIRKLLITVWKEKVVSVIDFVCLGVLVMWLAHGILDSFLEPHATAILFWLTLSFICFEPSKTHNPYNWGRIRLR